MEPICPPEKLTVFTLEERNEIKEIFNEAISEYFTSYSKTSRNILLGFATIIGSILVIFGGIKTMLGWLGIMILRQ